MPVRSSLPTLYAKQIETPILPQEYEGYRIAAATPLKRLFSSGGQIGTGMVNPWEARTHYETTSWAGFGDVGLQEKAVSKSVRDWVEDPDTLHKLIKSLSS